MISSSCTKPFIPLYTEELNWEPVEQTALWSSHNPSLAEAPPSSSTLHYYSVFFNSAFPTFPAHPSCNDWNQWCPSQTSLQSISLLNSALQMPLRSFSIAVLHHFCKTSSHLSECAPSLLSFHKSHASTHQCSVSPFPTIELFMWHKASCQAQEESSKKESSTTLFDSVFSNTTHTETFVQQLVKSFFFWVGCSRQVCMPTIPIQLHKGVQVPSTHQQLSKMCLLLLHSPYTLPDLFLEESSLKAFLLAMPSE